MVTIFMTHLIIYWLVNESLFIEDLKTWNKHEFGGVGVIKKNDIVKIQLKSIRRGKLLVHRKYTRKCPNKKEVKIQ